MIVYNQFKEVADDISKKIPTTIYKYRDWMNPYHRSIIERQELYFAHPHSLNDPYDVRPPYKFILADIDYNQMAAKIKTAGRALNPYMSEDDLDKEVQVRLNELRKDPEGYFKKNRLDYVLDSSRYDTIGVLSLCSTSENEAMWAHYGSNHSGFAVGFNSVRLAEELRCIVGIVDYNDDPIEYYMFGNNSKAMEAEIMRKSTKWESEREIRFLTLGIGIVRDRLSVFSPDVVEDVVFGLNTKEEVQKDVMNHASKKFPNVKFYKVERKVDAFGFERRLLK
jgi:hypothetical protein